VPLYILGSSLYGAQLAAALGLPFAFASHFAPQLLHQALHIYRDRFNPSRTLDAPYAMAAMGVICADTDEEAQRQFQRRRRMFVRHRFSNGGRELTDEQVDAVLASPQAAHIDEIFTYAAVGTPDRVATAVASFRSETSVDEVVTSHYAGSTASRVRSLELTAAAVGLAPLVDA
jgi:luciferase family oxidoreductase group 1